MSFNYWMKTGIKPSALRQRLRIGPWRQYAARAMRWRPGIAMQLGVAFVGVAALAAVANFAVQRTISITTTRTIQAGSSQAPRAVAGSDRPASTSHADTEAQLAELERLVNTVETALLAPASDKPRLGSAAVRWRRGIAGLQQANTGVQVDAALAAGLEAIDITTQRRATFDDYSNVLGGIDARLQDGLNRSWKILGRVVARQSLVALDVEFKELRRQAEVLREDSYTAADQERLQEREARMKAALLNGERSLARSQGAEWYSGAMQELDRLTALREKLGQLDGRKPAILRRFGAEVGALRMQLARSADAAVPETAAVVVPLVQPLPDASTLREYREEGGIARRDLAALSVVVLALLFIVSVGTVLSILRPVRRLVEATGRIARGEAHVRVARGGGPELDGLAVAFNQMAANLEEAQAVAQTYQQRLEMRVSERTRQLQHQADHDALTQLPNRRQLFHRLGGLLDQPPRRGHGVGLYFIDLDNFKIINDGMGHGFGDRVLLAVAERLCATVGSQGFAARFAGDEFTVIVDAGGGTDELTALGWSLVRAFQKPLSIDGRELLVSVSVGAAFHPQHGSDAESLLRAADAAMFRAKALGRSQLSVFTPDLLEAASSRFSTEQGLRQAIDRGELELVFQPEINLSTLEVDVCEALLRWRTPDGQLISPDQFVAVAEESGLIIEINDWVLRTALAAVARWRRGGFPAMRVAVNVSSRQFFDAGFPDRVSALLAAQELSAGALEIELTENVLQTGAATMEGLRRLQQLGVAVALDDFGTGYSSLASLEALPLNRVKLDRSLVAGVDTSMRSAAIAGAIIRLCGDLGVQITAEGVERTAQLAFLREHPVHLQGYLLSRPVAEGQLRETLQLLPARLQALLLEAEAGEARAVHPSAAAADVSRAAAGLR